MKNTTYPKGFYEFFTEPNKDTIRSHQISNLSFLPHMHVEIEMVYVTEGELRVQIDDQIQLLSPHTLAFIAPHKIHTFDTPTTSHSILTIFNPLLIPEIDHLLKQQTPKSPFIYDLSPTLDAHFQALTDSNTMQNLLLAKGHLSIILGTLLEHLTFTQNTSQDNYMVQIVLQHIYSHYQENISLSSLSSHLGLSKYYISHLFNQEIGCSLTNYINFLRVNKAKELLLSDKTITEIAYECGFESARSFYRAFMKFCGTTPLQYRKKD
ncbi:MAG: helix-turn-helix domain-containing protein [Cellulosilyticaceae bacterium]